MIRVLAQCRIELLRSLAEDPRAIFFTEAGEPSLRRRENLAERAGRGREIRSPCQTLRAECLDYAREERLRARLLFLDVAEDARRELHVDVRQVAQLEQCGGVGVRR